MIQLTHIEQQTLSDRAFRFRPLNSINNNHRYDFFKHHYCQYILIIDRCYVAVFTGRLLATVKTKLVYN